MSYLNGLTRAFQLRLAQNVPTGYAVGDIVNLDRGVETTISTKNLVQSTALGLRQNITAGNTRNPRQYFIHTVQINVPNSDRSDRADILTTVSEIQALFEKTEFDEYKTQTADIDIIGKQSDSKFYRVDVNINGYFEEIL